MKKKYLIEVTLTTDSDCYTIFGDKFIMDHELFDKFSGSKKNVLKFINDTKKQIKMTTYEVAYGKTHVPEIMSDIKSRILYALSEAKRIIKNDLFDSIPHFEHWSYGGNQYFEVKLTIV